MLFLEQVKVSKLQFKHGKSLNVVLLLRKTKESQNHFQVERNGGEKFRAREGYLEVKTLVNCSGTQGVSTRSWGNWGEEKATLTNYFIHLFVTVYWENTACLTSSYFQ